MAVLPPRRHPALRAQADAAGTGLTLRHHDGCFGCGTAGGLGLELELNEGGGVTGAFTPSPLLQGPPGTTHGGVVGMALDEAMALCVHQRTIAFTARFEMDLRGPAPVGHRIVLDARIDRREGRKLWTSAEAHSDGKLVATAEALIVEISPEADPPR